MTLSFFRTAVGAVVAFTLALGAVPAYVAARELATAQGTIAISEARAGLRATSCSELIVEARDALDDHLIAETRPSDEAGICSYSVTVPAQTAVWLRVRPMLVAGTRIVNGVSANITRHGLARSPNESVALRFTIIAPTTFFFAPNEQKHVLLSY